MDLSDGTIAGFCFLMNKRCFTRFPEEQEILLDDGRPFEIENIDYDVPCKEEPYQGKLVTHIYFKSCLPRGLQASKLGQLSTRCNF